MHSESIISLYDETASYRWSLLRLSLVFRYPESLEFKGRTHQRNFRFYKNIAPDGQASAAGIRRSFLGRRNAGTPSEAPARLQGDAEGNAQANGSATRFYTETHALTGFPKYFPPQHRGRRPDGLLRHRGRQATSNGSCPRDQRQRFVSAGRPLRKSLYHGESGPCFAKGRIRIAERRSGHRKMGG